MVRVIALCLLIAGCAPMAERECRVDNWYARGEQDGLMGWQPKLDLYASQCGRSGCSPPSGTTWPAGPPAPRNTTLVSVGAKCDARSLSLSSVPRGGLRREPRQLVCGSWIV